MRLFFALALFCLSLFGEYDPKNVSEQDIKRLPNVEKDIYELANQSHTGKDFAEILNLIWENRAIKISPALERLSLGLSGFSGKRSRRNAVDDDTLHPYSFVGLSLEYKIIDPKEARQKQQETLEQKASIAKLLREFYQNRASIKSLDNLIEILQIKDNLFKVRVATAVSNRAERLENLEALHAKRLELAKLAAKNDELLENLIMLVEPEFSETLRQRLLK